MDKTVPAEGRNKRRSNVIHTLFRWTGRLYTVICDSVVGRALTSYRRVDRAVGGGRQGRFHVASRGSMPVADAIKRSGIFNLLRGCFTLLYDLPMKFYGLFFLLYGLLGSTLYFVVPLIASSFVPNEAYLTVAVVLMVLSVPPLASHSTLRESVSRSGFLSLILHRYFCIPGEPRASSDKRMSFGAGVCSVSLALVAAFVALFVSPYLVGVLAVALILLGLVFSYPEAGVLMSTVLLPAAWVFPSALTPLAGIVLLTWLSFGCKLLRLHRTVRYDVADIAVLLLMVICLISGVGGIFSGTGQIMPSVILFLCLGLYFPVVHLMNTRAYIFRCLGSLVLSAVIVAAVCIVGRTSPAAADWLRGSRGGDMVADLFSSVRGVAVGVDRHVSLFFALALLPFFYALALRTRRLFARVLVTVLAGIGVYLALSSGSLGAIACLACVTLLFFLLLDHHSIGVGAMLTPAMIGVGVWYFVWHDPKGTAIFARLSAARDAAHTRSDALWQRVAQSPFGIGASADCEGGNLAVQAVAAMGWPGFVVAALVLALLIYKGLTALSYTATTSYADRALVLGLLGGVVGALLWGTMYGFLLSAPALMMLVLLCALGSAFANILFDEHDVRAAESMNDPLATDRVYRRG